MWHVTAAAAPQAVGRHRQRDGRDLLGADQPPGRQVRAAAQRPGPGAAVRAVQEDEQRQGRAGGADGRRPEADVAAPPERPALDRDESEAVVLEPRVGQLYRFERQVAHGPQLTTWRRRRQIRTRPLARLALTLALSRKRERGSLSGAGLAEVGDVVVGLA